MNLKNKVYRGNVYWVNFENIFPDDLHYQRGIRPAIVVSNNYNNFNSDKVIIVPCTTKEDALPQHTYVYIKDKKNYILSEMITTVDIKYLGLLYHKLDIDEFKWVEKAIKIQLGLY